MNMDDRDWLDRRLQAGAYLPDDGFTARVLERLPAPRRALVLRRRILAVAALVAGGLALVLVLPLVHSIQQALAGHSLNGIAAVVATCARQVPFQVGAVAVTIILALASLSAARRWM